jgi:hypothetical protein
MKCKAGHLLFTLFLISSLPRFCLGAAPKIFACPGQYSFVATNFPAGEETLYGEQSNWSQIVFWGRLDNYPGDGWKYRWDFGDGFFDSWQPITDFSAWAPLNSSYRYLKSTPKAYPTPSEPVAFYYAKLQLTPDGGGTIYSSNAVQTKVVNMAGIDESNGYSDPPSKIQRRTIVESIAKGRGLRYIYLMQNSEGGWDKDGHFPSGVTAACLCAFLIYGHGVDVANAPDDIFVQTVEDGFRFLGTLAQVDPGPPFQIYFGYFWDSEPYVQGLSMLALSAATGFNANSIPKTASGNPIFAGTPIESFTYGEILQGAANYAANMQKTRSDLTLDYDYEYKYVGGWRYAPNFTEANWVNDPVHRPAPTFSNGDLSCTQWPVLGFTALYDNWKIVPDPIFDVRANLLNYLRYCQFRDIPLLGDPDREANGDGAGSYLQVDTRRWPAEGTGGLAPVTYMDNQMVDRAAQNLDYNPSDPLNACRALTGTNCILQMCYYLSNDISALGTATDANTCRCGSPRCVDRSKDFQIDCTNPGLSCERVKHALDFIARAINKIDPSVTGEPSNYYSMYGNMKALRLYNIERMDAKRGPGLNAGILYYWGNFPPTDTSISYDWEQLYIQQVLKDGPGGALGEASMDPYGALAWTTVVFPEGYFTFSDFNRSLETSFAMLLLAPTVFEPITLRTELPVSKFDKLSFKGKNK